jgi:hypothetical protein
MLLLRIGDIDNHLDVYGYPDGTFSADIQQRPSVWMLLGWLFKRTANITIAIPGERLYRLCDLLGRGGSDDGQMGVEIKRPV